MIRICISTLKTEKLFWSFCLEIRNLVYSCCYAVEYTCRFTSDIEDYRSVDPVLSTLQKADRDSLRKIWFLRSTQHFFQTRSQFSFYRKRPGWAARKRKLCEEKMKETKTPSHHSFLPYFDLLHQAWTTGDESVFNCHWVQRYWINA